MKASTDPDAGADGPASIALIGMPGAGKSTLGPALARRLGRPWLDSDDEIERRLGGGSLRAYFTRHGEMAFRDLEQQVVIELAARRGCVVGTGGGSVLRRASRDALKSCSVAVYLHVTSKVLADRLRGARCGRCCRAKIRCAGWRRCSPNGRPTTARRRMSSSRPTGSTYRRRSKRSCGGWRRWRHLRIRTGSKLDARSSSGTYGEAEEANAEEDPVQPGADRLRAAAGRLGRAGRRGLSGAAAAFCRPRIESPSYSAACCGPRSEDGGSGGSGAVEFTA